MRMYSHRRAERIGIEERLAKRKPRKKVKKDAKTEESQE